MAKNYPDDDLELALRDVAPFPRPASHETDFGDYEDRPKTEKRYGLRLFIFAMSVVVLMLLVVSGVFAFASYDPSRFQILLQQARAVIDAKLVAADGQPAGVQRPAASDAPLRQFAQQGSESAHVGGALPENTRPETDRLPVPNVDGLVMLIRGSLNALNQANKTNNYSVFRELAGRDFQRANSGARLNELFAMLRGRHVDLLAANAMSPRLLREPWIDDEGHLRLIGFFPSRPEQINFELIFQPEDGTWRLYGLGVDTVPPSADAPQPEESAQAPSVAAREAPAKTPQINRQPQMPSEATMVALVREAVMALNQANATGNYSVLRELGAPGFQQLNSSGQLADAFADLRKRKLNLTPVTVIAPTFTNAPAIDSAGRLRLTGGFPSRPEQVNFDTLFQLVDDTWKIFGIGVNTSRLVPSGTAGANPNVSGSGGNRPGGQTTTPGTPAPTPRARPNG
jgi:hypothetical protein